MMVTPGDIQVLNCSERSVDDGLSLGASDLRLGRHTFLIGPCRNHFMMPNA